LAERHAADKELRAGMGVVRKLAAVESLQAIVIE
jgi:hypothetical protein